jgi:hypothetical protein
LEIVLTLNCVIRPIASGGQQLRAEVDLPDGGEPVYFKLLSAGSAPVELSWSPEAQVAMGLIPALCSGVTLQVDGELDPVFHENLSVVQDLFACWLSSAAKVDVGPVRAAQTGRPDSSRRALFFSGGVDSMFSLLRHRDKITDLIYVHGYDVALGDADLRQSVSAYMGEVARVFGVNLIEIETNLRGLLDQHALWLYGHGPALASVGHLFNDQFSHFYISSTYDYRKLLPCGTHPMLDPRWSSTSVKFLHDGAEVSRVAKVMAIAESSDARRLLRVCWVAPHAEMLNCCRCEKCIRTMVALKALNRLQENEAFKMPFAASQVRTVELNDVIRDLWQENYDLLTRTGNDPGLRGEVARLLQPSALLRIVDKLRAINRRRLARRKARRARR